MQVHVPKQRGDHTALHRTSVLNLRGSIFKHTGFEKAPNQAQHPLVRNPMTEEAMQPGSVHRVEKAFDVGLNDVIHRSTFDGLRHHPQGIVAATAGSESIGVLYEILLIST
jgi:hypothetical protein